MKQYITIAIMLIAQLATAQIQSTQIFDAQENIRFVTKNGSGNLTIECDTNVYLFNTITNTTQLLFDKTYYNTLYNGFSQPAMFNGSKGIVGRQQKMYLVNGTAIDSLDPTILGMNYADEPLIVFLGNEAFFSAYDVNLNKACFYKTDFTAVGTVKLANEITQGPYIIGNNVVALVQDPNSNKGILVKYANGNVTTIDTLVITTYKNNNELFYTKFNGASGELLKISASLTPTQLCPSTGLNNILGLQFFGIVDNTNYIFSANLQPIYRVNSICGDSVLNDFSATIPGTHYPMLANQNGILDPHEKLNAQTLFYTTMTDTAYFINNQTINYPQDFGYIKANGSFRKWDKTILYAYADICGENLFYIQSHPNHLDSFNLFKYDPVTDQHTMSAIAGHVSFADLSRYQKKSTVNVVNNDVFFSLNNKLYRSNACGTVQPNSIVTSSIEHNTIYPNPVQSTLYFSKSVSNITITDIFGKIVLTKRGITNQIDCSQLASGNYFIIDGDTHKVSRFTKE
jgi:hypothetical protein